MNKLDTLIVSITAQDIKTAIRKVREGWQGTPLTLAVRRAFDCKYLDPFVSTWSRKPVLYIWRGLSYDAAEEADFIRRWEAGEPVKPMSLRLQHDPEKVAAMRDRIIKYHERRCWGCNVRVPVEQLCCRNKFTDRSCFDCQAVFCKACFPKPKPFSSCRGNPDRHMALKADPFAPTFRHVCQSGQKGGAL